MKDDLSSFEKKSIIVRFLLNLSFYHPIPDVGFSQSIKTVRSRCTRYQQYRARRLTLLDNLKNLRNINEKKSRLNVFSQKWNHLQNNDYHGYMIYYQNRSQPSSIFQI